MAKNKNEGEVVVRSFPRKKQAARTGKPRKIATTSLRMGRTAYAMTGNTMLGAGGNFYSPELSTDFLELPQSIDERRNFYRFFYDHEPFVGQAIDLHVDLPLSKVRLAMPIARNRDLAEQAMRFCERWVREIHLLQRLLEISHEYHLLGEAVIFCEDTSPEMPRSVREREIREITAEGEIIEQWEEYEDADDREVEWLKKNYKGWTAIRCLPPEQVHIDSFPFTDEKLIKLVPDSKTVDIVQRAQDVGDTQAKRIVASMSEDIVNAILMGEDIILNTDPDAGSFAYVMARKRSQYEPRGQSILQRCLLPGTPIWVKQDGIIQQVAVEDVNDGTYVLTHKGRFQPCEAGSRLVEESVTSLSIEGIEDPLRLTSDHRVLRVAENGEEEWIEAGNLKEGDLVREAYIEPTEEPLTEIDLVAWWQGRSLEGLETESPNIKIPITKDFCYLLGTWLGGGCFWRNLHDVLSVGWDIQNGDLEVVERVREISSQYFLDVQELDSCKIQIKNSLLARWFKDEFRPTGPDKHLPEWVFNLPKSQLMSLLKGLLDTEGWLRVDKKSRFLTQVLIMFDSKILADQIHLICNRLGIKTQVSRTAEALRDWVGEWSLVCERPEDAREWAKGSIKGERLSGWTLEQYRSQWESSFIGERLTRKIKKIETFDYKGPVYSFSVQDDESHVTGGVETHNCLRTLVFRDKVRQSLTAISSRHMTPYRLVWAEDLNEEQVEELREQVDLALQDPDYSVITNYEVHWEEMGADQRLPDWSWVWDFTDRQLYAGLSMTESLLSGESSYSGDRIHLEVINTRYLLFRELMQQLVEEKFFKPMCRRMGFIEEDEDGNLQVLVPRLSFTRLALRDNQETFDALFNLYQKGSLDIDIILDLLNVDPIATAEKLKRDLFTQNDSLFNECLRNVYSTAGNTVAEQSDAAERIADFLGLTLRPLEEGDSRF